MSDLICPFSATLTHKGDFACPYADEVIRRGGAEYVCLQINRHDVCCEVHDNVKHNYLDSQGLEDDLLSLPHSTFVKIQFGCILGLQKSLGDDIDKIEDMGSLIADAIEYYNLKDLPFALINDQISIYKLQRRGNRKK